MRVPGTDARTVRKRSLHTKCPGDDAGPLEGLSKRYTAEENREPVKL